MVQTTPHGEGDVRDHVNVNYDPDEDNVIENFDPSAQSEGIEDIVGALIAAGANVSVTYDDAAGTLTVAAPDEQIEDLVAALVGTGVGVNISYVDSQPLLRFAVDQTTDFSWSGTHTFQEIHDGNRGEIKFFDGNPHTWTGNMDWESKRLADTAVEQLTSRRFDPFGPYYIHSVEDNTFCSVHVSTDEVFNLQQPTNTGVFSTTAGNAGTINIYYSPTTPAVEIENQMGADRDLAIWGLDVNDV